jgi:hypothetical protein
MQVLEREDNGLRPRPRQKPSDHRRQLPAPQLFRREIGFAVARERDVHEGCEERRMLGWVQADEP